MKNTPSFQYYPADLISDPDVMFWDMEMVGAYWQMITYLWLNGGEFALNIDNLRMIFHQKIGRTSLKLWQKIAHKFVMSEQCSVDSKITIVTHKRVSMEIQRQLDKRVKQSEGGKKGMANRWTGNKLVIDKLITSGISSDNYSSSTSSSTSIKEPPPITPPPLGGYLLGEVISNPKKTRSKKTISIKPYSHGFKCLWSLYPRKEGKGAASDVFEQLLSAGVNCDDIIRGLDKWLDSEQWNKDGGKWIPKPVNWLKDRAWDDEPTKSKVTA